MSVVRFQGEDMKVWTDDSESSKIQACELTYIPNIIYFIFKND